MSEHSLFPYDAFSEVVELNLAVSELLVDAVFWLPHLDLAVREVTARVLAYHHGHFINGQLVGCSVVLPVVVIGLAEGVKLIRVFLLDDFLPKTLPERLSELVCVVYLSILFVRLPIFLCPSHFNYLIFSSISLTIRLISYLCL